MALRGIGDERYAINVVRNLEYDLKQDIICGQILSLKYVTVSEIAHTLWRSHISKIKLSEINMHEIPDAFNKYEKEINNNISNLNIPKVCKKILEEFVHLRKEEFIHFFLRNFMKFSVNDDFLIFWNNLCWTQQISIDKVKTAAQIIDNSNLSIVDKYVLACENCLEEKIRHLHKLLPEDFITKFEENREESDLKRGPNYLVLFWTYYIKGNQEKFSNIIEGADPNSYLLEWSIYEGKETAVQYIWEKCGNEALKERLNYYFECANSWDGSSFNIVFYFFQQLSKIQQEEMSDDNDVLYILLRKVRNLLRWSNAFAIESYVFEIIKSKNVLDAFKIVMRCGKRKLLDLNQYETLWNKFILNFKFASKINFISICKVLFNNCYAIDKHYYKVSYFSLLKVGASQDIKDHMYTEDAGNLCLRLIVFYGPDIMDDILKQAFETEEEISKFDNHFFSTMGSKICVDLIRDDNYERANEFLDKYCDKKVKPDFKEKFAYKMTKNIFYFFPSKNSINSDIIFHLNKFIYWVFEENKEKISTYKSKVFDSEASFDNKDFFCEQLKYLIYGGNGI